MQDTTNNESPNGGIPIPQPPPPQPVVTESPPNEPPQPVATADPPNGQQDTVAPKNKKKWPFIVGAVVCLCAIAAAVIIYFVFNISSTDNIVVGDWKCKNFSGLGEGDKYVTRLQLNRNGTFVYGAYDDLNNNHYAGTYTIEDLHKSNYSGDYTYYLIKFGETTEFIDDGEIKDTTDRQMSEMEMGITEVDGKRSAATIFYSNYNMYYCYAD